MINREYDWTSIEPAVPGFDIYGHGEYEETSVLAGQSCRTWLGHVDTIEEALAAFPRADVLGCSSRCPELSIPDCPPEWFDQADIGERWDAED